MPSPAADATLISCLEAIRDVAADLGREMTRAGAMGTPASIQAMVAYIEHKAIVALKLINDGATT